MVLDPDYLISRAFDPVETVLSDRDAMFYALTIGLGRDPLDESELPYVFEKDLKIFPTLPLIVGHPGDWMADPRAGITRARVVHGAQRLWTYADMPLGRPVVSTNRVVAVQDKGDKGAVMIVERQTVDKASGALIARGESSVFCRADGGFGSSSGDVYEFRALPERRPDRSREITTDPNAALLYRLNHDRNPLHADPELARKVGFERPILHGLCTFGLAASTLGRAFGAPIAAMEARFSKPVLPGDAIAVDMWEDADGAAFRVRVPAREAVALDRGRVSFR